MINNILKKTSLIGTLSLFFAGCGGSGDSTPSASDNPVDTERQLATKIILDKVYKDTVSAEDQVDYFRIDGLKAGHEYYFHLKNIGESHTTKNYAYTYVAYWIEDGEGEITKGKLSTVLAEKTYPFTAREDGTVYVKFDSKYSLGYYDSRFEFNVKSGLDDGLKHDPKTFEYNDFQKVAYPISLKTTYKSTATGTKDSSDWYVLENMDSAKEYYLHMINLGDRNENPSANAVQCEILDENGVMQTINLATPTKEKTYTFSPINDGKVYLHFNTHRFGAIYGTMQYEFDVKE